MTDEARVYISYDYAFPYNIPEQKWPPGAESAHISGEKVIPCHSKKLGKFVMCAYVYGEN